MRIDAQASFGDWLDREILRMDLVRAKIETSGEVLVGMIEIAATVASIATLQLVRVRVFGSELKL